MATAVKILIDEDSFQECKVKLMELKVIVIEINMEVEKALRNANTLKSILEE